MKYSKIGLTAFLTTTLAASSLVQADVPNIFADGEPAVAAEVNENFSSLDTRLTTLESAPGDANTLTISVDCDAGGSVNNSIAEAAPANHLFVNISGTCNERVVITRSNVSLLGDAATPATINFVETPLSAFHASLNANELNGLKGAINVIGASGIIIDNLTVTGATDTGTTIGESGKGIAVRFNGAAAIQNTTVTGNRYGISANSGGMVVLSASQINNNEVFGLIASDAGTVRLIGGNTISQTAPRANAFKNAAISVLRNSTVTILGDNTVTASPSADNEAIGAYYGAQVRSFYGLLTINGDSAIGYDSHVNFRDVNHTGSVNVFTKGTLRLQNRANQTSSGVTVTGNVTVGSLAVFTSNGGTTVDGSIICNGGVTSIVNAGGTVTGTICQ